MIGGIMIPGKAFGKGRYEFWQGFVTKWIATLASVSVWGFVVIFIISSGFVGLILLRANDFLITGLIEGKEWIDLAKSLISTFFTLLGTIVSLLMAMRKVNKKENNYEK
jgi:hypothetical protein